MILVTGRLSTSRCSFSIISIVFKKESIMNDSSYQKGLGILQIFEQISGQIFSPEYLYVFMC